MAQRIIKNYTDQNLVIADLGDIVIPANGALDIGGNEVRLIELSASDDLLDAISLGTESYQVNDGIRDLSKSEAIDLIRKIQRPTEVDNLGRWVIRSDSRKTDWDAIFQGAADDLTTGEVGKGTPFTFDFSAPADDLRWDNEHAPAGYKMQTIDWRFCDWVYIKEGTLFYYNAPKGSFMNFFVVAPPGTGYIEKFSQEDLTVAKRTLPTNNKWIAFIQWLAHYNFEGSAPMGDELNTESASDNASPSFFMWRAQICVPDVTGYEQTHGHWALEMYRISTGTKGPEEVSASKMVQWPPQ